VYGHESRCANLHGHNYRIHFSVVGDLDGLGRVMDFGAIKALLCNWLEANWDHRFLIWNRDPLAPALRELDSSVVEVPFNPTAEHIALYLMDAVAPRVLAGTGIRLHACTVQETAKCSAEVSRDLQSQRDI
jgi:6-pyruvoyltetrahydropterin/6-carboxytetrahydropterin synthase